MSDAVSFPRLNARTRHFTLGRPRGFRVSPDGERVVFLRSRGGTDPVTCLWALDLADGAERLVADPLLLLGGGEEDLPAEERARRERLREQAGGIVAYATDSDVTVAAFALAGRLFVAALDGSGVSELPVAGAVVDPRLDPTGARVAYVADGALHVVGRDGTGACLARDDADTVTWGLAEFVAAEEMDRLRGHWWSPDGTRLAVARVDEAPVARWWIADPAEPGAEPAAVRYPAAGTPNADVTLAVVDLDGRQTPVAWDRSSYPYLVEVVWNPRRPLTLLVQTRDQRRMQVLTVDADTGATAEVHAESDEAWLEIVPGSPDWTVDGRLVWVADDPACDTRRLVVGGEPVTPAGLQVEAVLHVDAGGVLVSASSEPSESHVHAWDGAALTAVTVEPGVHAATRGGPTTVVVSATLDGDRPRAVVRRGDAVVHEVGVHSEPLPYAPRVTLLLLGRRELRTAVVLPSEPVEAPLPVLMAPYGGPHAVRAVAAASAYQSAQWWADQGFAVVVADGRGTPGRGPAWERAVRGDLATAVLDDQVDALKAAAGRYPELDVTRVAIHGWSFGGYLAALAVLRRPDVFSAAVAGAPVTDWRLYDTHYTERYLGDPAADPGAYERSSLLADAARLERPLLLVHGLADDNVVAAHTLRLSGALLAAGRPHEVLPLTGVTHMASQEVVAENLLLLELAFLRRALGLA